MTSIIALTVMLLQVLCAMRCSVPWIATCMFVPQSHVGSWLLPAGRLQQAMCDDLLNSTATRLGRGLPTPWLRCLRCAGGKDYWRTTLLLSIGTLGVVYGDIGASFPKAGVLWLSKSAGETLFANCTARHRLLCTVQAGCHKHARPTSSCAATLPDYSAAQREACKLKIHLTCAAQEPALCTCVLRPTTARLPALSSCPGGPVCLLHVLVRALLLCVCTSRTPSDGVHSHEQRIQRAQQP